MGLPAQIDTVAGTSTSFNLDGGDDVVALGASGDYLGLLTGDQGDVVHASGDTIDTGDDVIGTITGANDIVGGASGDSLTIVGNDDAVTDGGGSVVDLTTGDQGETVNGSGETIDIGGDTGVVLTGSGDTVNIFYGANQITIDASDETIKLGSYDNVSIVGSHDTIDGSSYDTVVATGTYDSVSASDSDISYGGSSDAGDDVYGGGDSGGGWADPNEDDSGGDSGWGDSGGGSGAAAGITRTMSVIAQYDLANGYTAQVAVADAAWGQAQQAILASTDSSVTAPSPFDGIKWTGKIITWSFATGAGSSTAPFSGSVQAQYQAVVEQALQAWGSTAGLTFVEAPDSVASDIRIGWGDFDTTSSGTVGYTSVANGAAGSIQSVIVRLEDPSQDPLVAGTGGALTYTGTDTQLYQVALHEIGHALGLAESSDPNSVMFPELGATNTALDTTDVTNINALYNPSAVSGSNATALLTQAMASFGVSSVGTTTTLPTLQPAPVLTLAAATH